MPAPQVLEPAAYTTGMTSTPLASPTRRVLRQHQARSRDRVLGQFETSDRALLVSACGTGKTLTLHGIVERAGARRVAAFFPSLALVDQTLIEWGVQFEGRMRAVVVCSDQTVGQRFKAAAKDDEAAVSDAELEEAGAQVVRDVDALSLILQTHDTDELPLIVFSTYQSSEKVAQAQANTGVWFDFAIADEAHKLAVKSREDVSGRTGKLVLDADAILAHKRVFATATPKTFTYSATTENHRGAEASMDNTDLFGEIADTVGLRDAINLGLLTDYRIHVMGISPTAVRHGATGEDIDEDDPDVRMVLGVAALRHAQEELGVTRVIAYLSSRTRANEFAALVNGSGTAECTVITGDQPTSERKPKLEKLATDGGVIANVRCLTEGVDVPALDAVLFVDPRTSKIDIVQAVGRAIRTAPGKTLGHVLLPVLHDPGTPEEGWLDGNGYRGVWDVIAQMAENDTEVRAHLDRLAERGTRDPAHEGERFDIIQAHPANAPTSGQDVDGFTHQLVLRAAQLNDRLGVEWRENADAAGSFAARHGHDPWQTTAIFEERRLGAWLGKQRQSARVRKLSPERHAYLDRVYPGLFRDAEREWRDTADALSAMARELGRNPQVASGKHDESFLARWLVSQRSAEKKGTLSVTRSTYLDSVYREWSHDREEEWRQIADAAAAFFSEHGRHASAIGSEPGERRLGQWLGAQRTAGRTGTLSQPRLAYFESVYPEWSNGRDMEWEENADSVSAFFRANERWPTKVAVDAEEARLGNWLSSQRVANRRGTLLASRIAYFDRLHPGWSRGRDEEWLDIANSLVHLVSETAHWPAVRAVDIHERRLGQWLSDQRGAARKGKLLPWRRDWLEQHCPGWLPGIAKP